MPRFFKTLACLAGLALGSQPVFGFSLLGPINEAYQAGVIGYNLGGDIGAPKNLGEEYRYNTPVFYYAFDANFLDYFGSNGTYAVESAIAELNDVGRTNFTTYSHELTEFPLTTFRIKPVAQALHLLDVKSVTLSAMVEQLGLAEAERWLWTLRARATQPGLSCPFMTYNVIRLNFDPVSDGNPQNSSYINGVLYSYLILEFCTGPDPLAVTANFPVNSLAFDHAPVQSLEVFNYGVYSTGLTRDDVGGLRYLYSTNNYNFEANSATSLYFETNRTGQTLFTSNLTLLAAQAITNGPGALLALYPNLVITDATTSPTNFVTLNVITTFTNYPWDLIGTPPHPVFTTNLVVTPGVAWNYTFGNVIGFRPGPNGSWQTYPIQNIWLSTNRNVVSVTSDSLLFTNLPWAPAGLFIVTNVSTARSYVTNIVSGEYLILPTNLCDVGVLSIQATNIIANTNLIISFTNNFANTNLIGSNAVPTLLAYNLSSVDWFTNHAFFALQVNCITNASAVRQGMNRFEFRRASYDSLLGRFFQPITNTYSLMSVTNSALVTNWFQEVLNGPTWLFSAQDLERPPVNPAILRSASFDTNNEGFGLAGPGILNPPAGIVYTKIRPENLNIYTGIGDGINGLSERESITNFIWGSFDGSTNLPIIYPSGTSILDLEREILFQITTPALPDGRLGIAYSFQLEASGGQTPYTWSPALGSSPLPSGLAIDSGGIISGTPTSFGTFSFTPMVTEAGSRTRSRTYTLVIHP